MTLPNFQTLFANPISYAKAYIHSVCSLNSAGVRKAIELCGSTQDAGYLWLGEWSLLGTSVAVWMSPFCEASPNLFSVELSFFSKFSHLGRSSSLEDVDNDDLCKAQSILFDSKQRSDVVSYAGCFSNLDSADVRVHLLLDLPNSPWVWRVKKSSICGFNVRMSSVRPFATYGARGDFLLVLFFPLKDPLAKMITLRFVFEFATVSGFPFCKTLVNRSFFSLHEDFWGVRISFWSFFSSVTKKITRHLKLLPTTEKAKTIERWRFRKGRRRTRWRRTKFGRGAISVQRDSQTKYMLVKLKDHFTQSSSLRNDDKSSSWWNVNKLATASSDLIFNWLRCGWESKAANFFVTSSLRKMRSRKMQNWVIRPYFKFSRSLWAPQLG